MRPGSWRAGAMAIAAGVLLCAVLVSAASAPSAVDAQPKRTKFFVPFPAPGDASVVWFRFRGKKPPAVSLPNYRKIPASGIVFVARRRPPHSPRGTSELWVGVLNRGPGAEGLPATRTGGTDSQLAVSVGAYKKNLTQRQVHLSAMRWPALRPAWCNGLDLNDPRGARNPKPIQGGWSADYPDPYDFLDILLNNGACDQPLDPQRARRYGVPHGDFRVGANGNQLTFDGSTSIASRGFVVTRLPPGAVGVAGPDGARCQLGSRGTENYNLCAIDKAAGQPISFTLGYNSSVDRTLLAGIQASIFDPNSNQFGPNSVTVKPP